MWVIFCDQQHGMEKTKSVKIKNQSQLFYGMEVELSYNCLLKEREKEIWKEGR